MIASFPCESQAGQWHAGGKSDNPVGISESIVDLVLCQNSGGSAGSLRPKWRNSSDN